jgi:hypothetical protein
MSMQSNTLMNASRVGECRYRMPELSAVPDDLDELAVEMPLIVDLIARTARWVQPEVFRAFSGVVS